MLRPAQIRLARARLLCRLFTCRLRARGAMRSSLRLAEGLSVLMAGTERGVVCLHGERVAHLIAWGVGGVLATPDSQYQTLLNV